LLGLQKKREIIMDNVNKEIKRVDFLNVMYKESIPLLYIYNLYLSGHKLEMLIGSENPDDKRKLVFKNVCNYEITMLVEFEDDELFQSIISFDYWESDEKDIFNWEIKGDGCTWNFNSSLPEISGLE